MKNPKCPTCRGKLIVFVTDKNIYWCNACRNTKRLKSHPKPAPELKQRRLFDSGGEIGG